MPTPEEIKKLSDAYAEYMCPVGDYCGGVYDDQRNSDLPIYKDDAKSLLEWLSKGYCIIPKSKMKERYKESKLHSKSESVFDIHTGIARIIMLESLFGKDMFKEDNNQYTIPQ